MIAIAGIFLMFGDVEIAGLCLLIHWLLKQK